MVLLTFYLALSLYVLVKGLSSDSENYNGGCQRNEYHCMSGECIRKRAYCDGFKDCADQSDELYCGSCEMSEYHYRGERCIRYRKSRRPSCPPDFFNCGSKCIPNVWVCDGHFDCYNGTNATDESDCVRRLYKVPDNAAHTDITLSQYLLRQVQGIISRKWGQYVARIAVAMHLGEKPSFPHQEEERKELRYEEEISVLSRLLRRHTEPLTDGELALHIHALLVTCNDPKNFHGFNLISELRQLISKENITNPFAFLALCNAGDKMTETDVNELLMTAEEARSPYGNDIDIQALAVMAISCIAEKHNIKVEDKKLSELNAKLMMHQNEDGSILNLKSTALVIQALVSSNDMEYSIDAQRGISYLLSNKGNGSFGSIMNAYYIYPLLQYNTLMNISSKHCIQSNEKNDYFMLEDMKNRNKKQVHVKYSIWFGENIDVAHHLTLRVAWNTSVFEIMNLAAAVDEKFKFKSFYLDSEPYAYLINEQQNDPEKRKLWCLFRRLSKDENIFEFIEKSPGTIYAIKDEHYAMWYKRYNPYEKLFDLQKWNLQ